MHFEKWCVFKCGSCWSISGSQAEGHMIEETRRHQLVQLISSNAVKVCLPLHKPLLSHPCRYRYGSVHALQFVSPSFQLQFTQMSDVKHAHLYSRNQNKNTTQRWKQTCFHTFVQFASRHNWATEISCSLIRKHPFQSTKPYRWGYMSFISWTKWSRHDLSSWKAHLRKIIGP